MKIDVDGHLFDASDTLLLGNCHLLTLQGSRGILGCGYLSPETAEKFGHALAIVRGVSSPEDMLSATVQAVTSAARELGIREGMSGKEALQRMI